MLGTPGSPHLSLLTTAAPPYRNHVAAEQLTLAIVQDVPELINVFGQNIQRPQFVANLSSVGELAGSRS